MIFFLVLFLSSYHREGKTNEIFHHLSSIEQYRFFFFLSYTLLFKTDKRIIYLNRFFIFNVSVERNFLSKDQQFSLMTNYVQMEMRPSSLEHTHSEIFEFKSKQDDSNATHSGDFDHIRQDLERTNPVRSLRLNIFFFFIY